MIDLVEIQVQAGDGGDGVVSFRREKYVPRGGPDGGDGGAGGSVFLHVDSSLNTLLHLRSSPRLRAQRGGHGRKKDMHGRSGEDLWVGVPAGTRVFQWADGDWTPVVDLHEEGSWWCAVRGGDGGRGNVHFASPTNRTPLLAEAGEVGGAADLLLELQLLADVALIGKPNAGKSTLLSTISRARPKAAPYPFTTLDPVLGVVEYRQQSFVAVEIPGLIEGSHQGSGLGDAFLRHARHSHLFLHVVDTVESDPVEAYGQVRRELEQFDAQLAERPEVVAASKNDIPESGDGLRRLQEHLEAQGRPVYSISAATGNGIDACLGRVMEVLAQVRGVAADGKGSGREAGEGTRRAPAGRSRRPRVHVTRDADETFVVECPQVERLAKGSNLGKWHGRVQFWGELRRLGVAEALEEAGVGSGDIVRIGDVELEWA